MHSCASGSQCLLKWKRATVFSFWYLSSITASLCEVSPTQEFRSSLFLSLTSRQVKIRPWRVDALVCRSFFTYPSHSPSDVTSLLTLDWCLCVCLHRRGVWIDVCCWLRRKVHCRQVNPAAAGPGRIAINNAWKEQIIYNSTERWAYCCPPESQQRPVSLKQRLQRWCLGVRVKKGCAAHKRWQNSVKNLLVHCRVVRLLFGTKTKTWRYQHFAVPVIQSTRYIR